MPPGQDILARRFGYLFEQLKNQAITSDVEIMRAVMEDCQKHSTEPTDVIYEDEDGVRGMGPALWCIPLSARNSNNVILYFHGGGFVTNSPASHRKMGAHFAKAAGCKMLMVNYRLAPEYKFPKQIEDALDAYNWLLSNHYSPENIVTMGDSAGGNLCTSVVLKLREIGEPLPAAIVAISPWYDMEFTSGTIDSCAETDALVHRNVLQNMVNAFLPPKELKNPMANLLFADPKGLPPIYLIAGGFETLKDNATKFAKNAEAAGVQVELEIAEGMQHVYTFMAGKHEQADRTIANVGKWLKLQLGG